ncbi:hypothetical protein, partial [Staphylococcus aureus]
MSSKDAKKSQEEARLQQLKQEMRNSTDNMVSNAKNNVALKSQTLNEIIETINNSSQNLEGTFEGKASVNSGLKMLFYGGLKMSFFSGLR